MSFNLLQRHNLPPGGSIWLGLMSTFCDSLSQAQKHNFRHINYCIICSVSHRAAL